MPQLVATGSPITCTFGAAPSVLTILPKMINGAMMPAGNIMDNAPMVNIAPFGMCMSLANPMVAAATAAALGVLTPQPCVPATAAPWTPGSATVKLNKLPALTTTCKCMCNWGGQISIAGTTAVTVNCA